MQAEDPTTGPPDEKEAPCQKERELYELEPILPHFGARVYGFSLDGKDPLPPHIVEKIKADVRQHRMLVFKGQGRLSGERQVQITQQLGELESTFYKHPRSPHPDIFRVSNDEREGCREVGRSGWHIDGTFLPKPFKYQTMHFHSVCEGGDTWFVPLKELYEAQDAATKERWEKLWMVTSNQDLAHPFVYKHPERGDTTMVFHCGDPFVSCWITLDGKVTSHEDMRAELTEKLDALVDEIGIKMQWEEGDFAINDNLGNCHYASPGTQRPAGKAGLRILHRTTVQGDTIPTKDDGQRSFRP